MKPGPLLCVLRHEAFRRLVNSPAVRDVVSRYIAGDNAAAAVAAAQKCNGQGLFATLALVGKCNPDAEQVRRNTDICLDLVETLSGLLGTGNDISVDPQLVGLRSGLTVARQNLREIVSAAADAEIPVTLDTGGYQDVASTIQLYRELGDVHPDLAIEIDAALVRSFADLTTLARDGARLRLCADYVQATRGVAFRSGHQTDLSFVRCLRQLMESDAYPIVATHDQRIIPIVAELASRTGRMPDEYEFLMLRGVRAVEQRRLADTGHRCRVYLPFGPDWEEYLIQRWSTEPKRWLRAALQRR